MTRREALNICYSAHSRAEIEAAKSARSQYLAEHPHDEELLDMGEMLTMCLEALDLLGVDEIEPAPFPTVEKAEPAAVA